MATYEIIEINDAGMIIEWDGGARTNHEIPIVMKTTNPPLAAVELAIMEMYIEPLNPVATPSDIIQVQQYVGLTKTFTPATDTSPPIPSEVV